MNKKNQYVNKFHNFKFETDSKKNMEANLNLPNNLHSERISDSCSNETLIRAQEAAEKMEEGY